MIAGTDPATPINVPPPGIVKKGNHDALKDSSQADVSYLSRSAGSYDSLMEEDGARYNEAPSQ